MPTKPLTTVETAVLFILLAEAGPVANADLAREHGCYLKREARGRLVSLQLIEVERVSGRLVLTLSEKGWALCRAELASGAAPPRSGAVGGALFAVLRRWDRYLTACGLSLGDFVKHSGETTPAKEPPGETEVEERVRTAYERIAAQPGELVSLANLRDGVGDLVRADVDAALRRLHRRPGVTLVPEANQKSLDRRCREAAVVIGDQPKHAIAIRVS